MRNGQNKRMRNRNGGHSHNNNNNRRGQNPMTRVYESNGPEIKIRGTASHLAEKYVQLARDAQGAGDPVAAENYYQHAEHYFRIIAAAQEQFRQNQPQQYQQQPRQDGDIRDDAGDDADGEFSAFGAEPGFAPQPQPQPQQQQPYPPRDPQPYQREQQFRENRPQPQPQDDGDIDRLPSFITGGQPQQAQPSGGYDNGEQRQERGDRFQHRRRRRHHGPRPEGAGAQQGGDFGQGPGGE
jgi:hypothetical protein